MNVFIGRQNELTQLKDLSKSLRTHLVVVKGRRRIGKSRLIQEFAKDKKFFNLTGLVPLDSISPQDQRNNFARQLAQTLNLPPFTFLDWSEAFTYLSYHLTNEPTVILFDEISWMGDKDPTFIPKLKSWFDIELQHRPNITLVFCGSVSMWIEENIINSTAFFGRISLTIELSQLSLSESVDFLQRLGFKGSAYEIFRILSVTGGIPWYLEQISANQMADDNIKRLCFSKNGLLTLEFEKIFHDLFQSSGTVYKKIIHILSDGMKTLADIREALNYSNSGTLSVMLRSLITSGFVTQHYQWSIKRGKLGKQSLYRLSDCYIRFYVKYIEANLSKIQQDYYKEIELSQLPNWQSILGFQIESLLLQNRFALLQAIGIKASDIAMDNPYIQHTTQRQKGCQIDYLIQTHTKNLFICEFKFNKRELGTEIIEEMKEKIERFSKPNGFGVVPILFHFGGVTSKVYESGYFYKIIDINDLVQAK